MERLHAKGWGIEVLSWESTCATALRSWSEKVGCFIPLDDYAESIAFEQGVTAVKALNLRGRPLAKVTAPASPSDT
jgi:hypothetical protein